MKNAVKSSIRKLLLRFGLEVRSARSRRTTLGDVLRHLKRAGFRPATVIDVGVAYGTPALIEEFPSAEHLLVEPLEEYEPVLEDIARRVSAGYVLAAAGPEEGRVTLHVHRDLSSSSTLRETEGSHVDGEPREVPMMRLDRLCRERKLAGPYLLKIDVQGAELSVLEGASEILGEAEVVVLEVSLFRFYEGGPEFHEVVDGMKRLGYVVYDVFGGHHRPLDGALAQIDLVFVREDGALRKSHHYAGPEQREELLRRPARLS